jgi:hypothetical protein
MFATELDYLVKRERFKDLIQEAAAERLLSKRVPLEASRESFGRSVLRQARAWLAAQERSIPCNEALPACGLLPV